MRKFLLGLLCATCVASGITGPAAADAVISGPACVVDGNHIQIGGKMRNGKCWGGIDVVLHGSKAPHLREMCFNKAGIEWPCGQAAANVLKSIIRLATATCYHIDGEFQGNLPVATCLTGRKDVSRELVKAGLAKSGAHKSDRYGAEAQTAERRRLGLWK